MTTIGSKIIELRKKHNFTQERLAEKVEQGHGRKYMSRGNACYLRRIKNKIYISRCSAGRAPFIIHFYAKKIGRASCRERV